MISRRWHRPSLFAVVLTLIGMAVFVRLGIWQLDRAAQAQALLDAFHAAPQAALEDFAAVAKNPPLARYPHVQVAGHFVAAHGYLRDEQVREAKLGVEAVDAFEVDGSDALLLVNRGWIPWSHAPGTEPNLPPLPDGEITLRGVYAPFPGSGIRVGGNSLPRQKTWPKLTLAIDANEVAADLGKPLLPRILLLDAEPSSGFMRAWTPSLMPPERHRAYAFQWFAFVAAALAMFTLRYWRKI
jgi:cytochrome oxidase assembly protein ShyY1